MGSSLLWRDGEWALGRHSSDVPHASVVLRQRGESFSAVSPPRKSFSPSSIVFAPVELPTPLLSSLVLFLVITRRLAFRGHVLFTLFSISSC